MHKRKDTNILQLFEEKDLVKICAPMVRYSKLQFRTLVRSYNCDLCYTPMILADSFCRSPKARNSEFTTNLRDSPVVAQFAANTVDDFVRAAKLISPHCDGVDLNCGCPQRWAKQMGIGCIMLEKPELISDLVRNCRNQIPKPFSVSVKMRIQKNLKKTIELCKQLESCGVSYLSVHSRTSSQLTGAINLDALKLIVENVNCPVVANGGVRTLSDCEKLRQETKCRGVMVANGLLTNPALFSGTKETPMECVQEWLDICYNSTLSFKNFTNHSAHDTIPEKPPNLTFQCFHHHLVFMLEKVLPKSRRRIFNNLQTFEDVLEFLREEFDVVLKLLGQDDFKRNEVLELEYDANAFCKSGSDVGVDFHDYLISDSGKYFQSRTNEDYADLANLFLE